LAHRLNRREFLAAAGGAALAAGCGERPAAGGGPFRGQKLRIFVYAGGHERTMREAFVPAFEARTGATAVLDPGWWDSVPKLKASPPGRPAFDLVVTDATQGYPALREGLFQKLDLDRIPNRANLAPAALDNWVYREGYGITFPDSVMTLAYHKELVPFTPAGWGDLLRDEVRGKVALYNAFYMSLYTFACMRAAEEGKPGSAADLLERDLDGVLGYARGLRDRVAFWWPTSTDMALGLARTDFWLGNMHSPEMLQTLRERPELGAVVPAADRAFVQLMWVVPDGTPRKELAEVAIDLIFSEEMQRAFARRGSATAVLAAARDVAAEDPFWRQIYPGTEEQFRSLRYYPYDVYSRHWDHIVKVWDREVLRKG
jgi:spermidine/putrescine-binding protein